MARRLRHQFQSPVPQIGTRSRVPNGSDYVISGRNDLVTATTRWTGSCDHNTQGKGNPGLWPQQPVLLVAGLGHRLSDGTADVPRWACDGGRSGRDAGGTGASAAG